MTDRERDAKFLADFDRLRQNRQKVPLAQLQGKYEKAYRKLCGDVQAGGDWYADWYLGFCAESLPISPQDPEGNAQLRKKANAIIAEENRPGGKRDLWRSALIDRLDMETYNRIVHERFDRIAREAFTPYWSRHCHPVRGWIYNDILKKWWLPKRKGGMPGDGTGCWINRDYSGREYRLPPAQATKGRGTT